MPDLIDLPVDSLAKYQQQALLRLHLWMTGKTHSLFIELLDTINGKLLAGADSNGAIEPTALFTIADVAKTEWQRLIISQNPSAPGQWQKIFSETLYQAAAIPFGVMARHHMHYMSLEGVSERQLTERGDFPVIFENQVEQVLAAARSRVYSDGFNLSQRIWRLDAEGLSGIQAILMQGVNDQQSAWNIAKSLEDYLQPGRDCPRWTTTRLYKRSKAQIAAGDQTGLYSGSPCQSKGVSYNALRLARNELQIVHHQSTDAVFSRSPWITGENVLLSGQHPKADICDDVVAGNPYNPGEITLPLHVQCLCFKEAVLISDSKFVSKMQGWINGAGPWPAMDQYTSGLGVSPLEIINPGLLVALSIPLIRWLYGGQDEVEDVMNA